MPHCFMTIPGCVAGTLECPTHDVVEVEECGSVVVDAPVAPQPARAAARATTNANPPSRFTWPVFRIQSRVSTGIPDRRGSTLLIGGGMMDRWTTLSSSASRRTCARGWQPPGIQRSSISHRRTRWSHSIPSNHRPRAFPAALRLPGRREISGEAEAGWAELSGSRLAAH